VCIARKPSRKKLNHNFSRTGSFAFCEGVGTQRAFCPSLGVFAFAGVWGQSPHWNRREAPGREAHRFMVHSFHSDNYVFPYIYNYIRRDLKRIPFHLPTDTVSSANGYRFICWKDTVSSVQIAKRIPFHLPLESERDTVSSVQTVENSPTERDAVSSVDAGCSWGGTR